jgi:hypothetical protein
LHRHWTGFKPVASALGYRSDVPLGGLEIDE